ncbi:hypothetical protein N9O27_01640 [Flavobacteriaceae bacterium]|nr:hypothetical protein [Flavobacteriaceae bacterium]
MKLFGWELGDVGFIVLLGLMFADEVLEIDLPWWSYLIPVAMFIYSLIKNWNK